ncbi:unnamed protein product [Dimorphilus gyrociliatus]|uniref:Uncharacterized protein n=1 Tax=Dimorphilus gyrociliatus TaxID=2664684 RepID=A0A7I8VYL6_9ANNE|nr:unnamed protein product [Dimorphilus gyrociliatus]
MCENFDMFDMKDISYEVYKVGSNIMEVDLEELRLKVFEANHPVIEIPLIFQNFPAIDKPLNPFLNVHDHIMIKTCLEPIFLNILSNSKFREKRFYNTLKELYENDNSLNKYVTRRKLGRFCTAQEYFIKYRILMAKKYFEESFFGCGNSKNVFLEYLTEEIKNDKNWDKVEEILIPIVNPYTTLTKSVRLNGINAKQYFAIQYRIMHIITRLIEDSNQPLEDIINIGFFDIKYKVCFNTTEIVTSIIGQSEINPLATYNTVYLGSYNEISKAFQTTGYHNNYETNLIMEMIIFSATGIPIDPEDILISSYPCKYTETLNEISFIVLFEQISIWLTNSDLSNDLRLPIAHAKCILLLETGYLQLEEVFKKNSLYGIFSKGDIRNRNDSIKRTIKRIEEVFSNKMGHITDEAVLERVYG